MSLLIFTFRKFQIIHLKSKYNLQLSQLRNKLMELQDYTSRIADGIVSVDDLSKVSSNMFGRMSIFMQYSDQMGASGANQNFAMMQATNPNMFAAVASEQLQQYKDYIWNNLYQQSCQKASEVEKDLLNREETKINNEMADIESKLKMLGAEEEQVSKAEDDAAKKSAPQYVA